VFYALKAFFLNHAANKGNLDLQFIPYTEVQADVAGGTVLLTGAARLYFAYAKKENSATDNITFFYDDATDDTTDANARIGLSVLEANESCWVSYPNGMPLATGIVVTQYTSASGLGKADGSNGANGFVIVGAA
jgi:hypothetical protein